MTGKAEQLVQQLEQANADLLATIEGSTDEQWRKRVDSDGRTVCVLAHHIAGSEVIVADWVRAIAAGQPISVSGDAIDDANRNHAERHADIGRDDVVERVRRNGQKAADILRGLNDEELSRSAPIAFLGGQELTAQQFAERILIGHVRGHLNDIRTAIGN
jgi:hypothetical protein